MPSCTCLQVQSEACRSLRLVLRAAEPHGRISATHASNLACAVCQCVGAPSWRMCAAWLVAECARMQTWGCTVCVWQAPCHAL